MSAQTLTENLSVTSNTANVSTDTYQSIVQDYSLIWLDTSIDETNEVCQNTLEHLRNIVNNVNVFTNQDECVDFLTEFEEIKVFLIIDDTIGQQIVPLIHDIPQLDRVYIFCHNTSLHNEWINEWTKVKSIHTTITSICAALEVTIKQCNQDSIALSVVPLNEIDSSENFNELEPTFMYTQIFKEILLDMTYDETSIRDFSTFCRHNNFGSSKNIEFFEKEYHNKSAVWWYAWPAFIYVMLNCALRTLEANIIIKMGFFISDLHHQIEQLYREQLPSYDGKPFEVYRGQGLLKADFEKLVKAKGGLISFNNFLSTSKIRDVSHTFAETAALETTMIGLFFVISIDPSVSSAPFASIQHLTSLNEEAEILFSMHTVFRIVDIKQIDNDSRLYQVELQLTADDDKELRLLTKHISDDVKGDTGWKRLGNLLLKLRQYDIAIELYNVLLEQTSNDHDKIHYYNQLGHIKWEQGDPKTAVWYFFKTTEIKKRMFAENHSNLDVSNNNNVSFTCCNVDEHTRILQFYDNTSIIDMESFLPDNISLMDSSDEAEERSDALLYAKNAFDAFENTLSSQHPQLTTACNNIGEVYDDVEKSSTALRVNKRILEIRQKTLPPDHPDFALSYHNIARIYADMGEHLKALSFYEKSLEINQKHLPANHPTLAVSYHYMGMAYKSIDEHSTALSFCEKGLQIAEKSLPLHHSDLAIVYHDIASIYENLKDHSKSLSFYKKQLEIYEKTPPLDYPSFATCCRDIGRMYCKMKQHLEALPFFEKAVEIFEKTLPSNDADLTVCHDHIGRIYENNEEYSQALIFYDKALEVCLKTCPEDKMCVAMCHNNIGGVYYKLDEYSEALSHFEYALNIIKTSASADDPHMKIIQHNISYLKENVQV